MNSAVLKTVVRLLCIRGYEVTENDIQLHCTPSCTIFLVNGTPQHKTMAVISLNIDPIRVPHIRSIKQWIQNEEWQQVLLIVKQNLKTNLKDMLHQIKNCRVQIFVEDELYFDVTRHVSVPLHQQLSTEEVKKITSYYHCSIDQLPKLSAEDIVCRFYGFKRNDVIAITRNSDSVGHCKEYKVVF